MTEQEAMEIIMQVAYDGEFPINSNKAFSIACKALEKQIPRKPSDVYDKDIIDWTCGRCGRFHRNDHKLKYCSECGQAIKWE